MSRRESRTISVLEGDWERWADLAYAARVSRSEYIRRAVEAYSEQGNGNTAGVGPKARAVQFKGGVSEVRASAPSQPGEDDAAAKTGRVPSAAVRSVLGRPVLSGAVRSEAGVGEDETASAGNGDACGVESAVRPLSAHAPSLLARPRPVPKEQQTRRRKK